MNTRVVFALIIINKAGGLIYQRDFAEGLNKLSINDYLVLAGTFHGFVSPPNQTSSPRAATNQTPIQCPCDHHTPQSRSLIRCPHLNRFPTRTPLGNRGARDRALPTSVLQHAHRDQVPALHGSEPAECRLRGAANLRAIHGLCDEEPVLPDGDADTLRGV
jgi:hypothetical protein